MSRVERGLGCETEVSAAYTRHFTKLSQEHTVLAHAAQARAGVQTPEGWSGFLLERVQRKS